MYHWGRRATQGFVMLIVLILMQVFSLLGVYELINTSSTIKIHHYFWIRKKYEALSRQILHKLEKNITHQVALCNISLISAFDLANKTLSWWQANTCHGNVSGSQYYYAIEALGRDPCGMIDNNARADYYRITLLMELANIRYARILLQSTVAIPSREKGVCMGKAHPVIAGHQGWHEIE